MSYTYSKHKILQISIITLLIGIVVTTAKVLGGIFGHSEAMLSDAVHSLFDVLSTLLVIISVFLIHVSTCQKEKRHNQIVQGVFSMILAIILLYTCVHICVKNFTLIFSGEYLTKEDPAWFEIAIAIGAIVAKEFVFHFNIKASKTLDYPPLGANAWHQRLDSLTSIGTLVSILLVNLCGLKIADPIVAIMIALFLLFIIFEDGVTAIEKLLGKKFRHQKKHRHAHLKHLHADSDLKTDEPIKENAEDYDAFLPD